jgi:hypothetical protein
MATNSINELKKQLECLGISSTTPGLLGEERFEELSRRLDDYAQQQQQQQDALNFETEMTFPVNNTLAQLTMSEIRTRLASLGENTNTIGLVGEARRNELMKRLTIAVCGNSLKDDQSEILLVHAKVSFILTNSIKLFAKL